MEDPDFYLIQKVGSPLGSKGALCSSDRRAQELEEYMVSTAIRNGDNGERVELGEFQSLDMEEILAFGEKASKP